MDVPLNKQMWEHKMHPDIEICREERRFSLLEPGEYVSLCFEFTKYQDRIAAHS